MTRFYAQALGPIKRSMCEKLSGLLSMIIPFMTNRPMYQNDTTNLHTI